MAGATELEIDNAFWAFSQTVYAEPEVAAACLELQDQHGAEVNLLLLAAWLGAARGTRMQPADVAALPGISFQEAVILPLRAARRHLRQREAGKPAMEALYQEVKRVEIAAEQLRQAELFAWAVARWPVASDEAGLARENLALLLGDTPGTTQLLEYLVRAAEAKASAP